MFSMYYEKKESLIYIIYSFGKNTCHVLIKKSNQTCQHLICRQKKPKEKKNRTRKRIEDLKKQVKEKDW